MYVQPQMMMNPYLGAEIAMEVRWVWVWVSERVNVNVLVHPCKDASIYEDRGCILHAYLHGVLSLVSQGRYTC